MYGWQIVCGIWLPNAKIFGIWSWLVPPQRFPSGCYNIVLWSALAHLGTKAYSLSSRILLCNAWMQNLTKANTTTQKPDVLANIKSLNLIDLNVNLVSTWYADIIVSTHKTMLTFVQSLRRLNLSTISAVQLQIVFIQKLLQHNFFPVHVSWPKWQPLMAPKGMIGRYLQD